MRIVLRFCLFLFGRDCFISVQGVVGVGEII